MWPIVVKCSCRHKFPRLKSSSAGWGEKLLYASLLLWVRDIFLMLVISHCATWIESGPDWRSTHCQILPEILQLLKLCERSELVDNSQLFHSISQTRLLAVWLSQAKSKFDWKTSKITRQFRREKLGKNDNISGKIGQCADQPY